MRPAGRMPGLRRLPPLVRRVEPDVVLFDAWRGRYSDSPRAISEELHRRGAPLRHVWVIDGAGAPEWAETVSPASYRHLEAMGRARYVVANAAMPIHFRKKPGTTYVQTWHGTPLKRIAYDIARPRMPRARRYLRNFARDVASWDVLLTQNRFSTEVMRRAFHYEGEVLEAGYPRNDALAGPDAERVRAETRAALGIPDGGLAVLYAPTWRDATDFALRLDLPALAGALGPDGRVLLRSHQHVDRVLGAHEHPRIRDVSAVPDPRELLLAADVLVTDYSSVMFDFAVTGKPILLFVDDLAEYRDDLRGLYLDLASEAPGPLLTTTLEVIDAVHDLDTVRRSHEGAYERFTERYCRLDDGRAAERVVDAVFEPPSRSRRGRVKALFLSQGRAHPNAAMGHVRVAHALEQGMPAGVDAEFAEVPPFTRAQRAATAHVPKAFPHDLWTLRWHLARGWAARRLLQRRLAAGDRPDVVHVTTDQVSFLLEDLQREVPLVLSLDITTLAWVKLLRGLPADAPTPPDLRPLGALEARALRRAPLNVAWTDTVAREIRALVPAARMAVLHPGIDLEAFTPRIGPREDGPVRVLFVGGRWKEKGGPVLVDALAGELGRTVELHAVTPAEVEPREGLFVHSAAPGSDEVSALFRRADLLALPSSIDAVPWVVIEAMASGLPVVAGRVGSIPEMVDGCGIVVEPGDGAALREAVLELANDPARRAALGAAARRRAEERYDARRNTRQLTELLTSVARRRVDSTEETTTCG